ncbi:hypothetical protein Nepgr_011665 [Nepenthes gracilis]|uniref:Phosphoglycerate kinase n=1 Tax=Nepenthes gracilis TaxID=150966 RepID=A0AAD3XMI0_NEPGR|nr:hypothetical protein Nepgr_011665 [Nepenthes gracilis]
MIQYLHLFQGSLFAYTSSQYDFKSTSLVLSRSCYSCSYYRKCAKFHCYGSFRSSWQGAAELTNNAAEGSFKDKNCDRGNSFPHIQTLQRFPKEELYEKVVMVRFDSSILLQELLDKHIPSISSALFTIQYLYEAGAKVILISDWIAKGNSKLLLVDDVAEFLSSLLQLKVIPAKFISVQMQFKMEDLQEHDIILLENLSYFKMELANDLDFAERLSSGVDIFVNDSFSLAHKILASTVGITRFCHACVSGFHFEERMLQLKKVAECHKNPCVAIIGGGNLAKKAAALHFLASTYDYIVFVGMMGFQIMHALGMPLPLNLVEHGALEEAVEIIRYAKSRSTTILLPRDFLCANNQYPELMELFPAHGILHGWAPIDLGPNSLDEIASLLPKCEKIIWIGPSKFRLSDQDTAGTSKLASMLDNLSKSYCDILVVGNVACEEVIRISKSASAYQMIETASVVWEHLKGRNLPGLMALDRAYPYVIDWHTVYSDPARPLAVDLGSGNGLFLIGLASIRKDLNCLGLEINKKLVSGCLDSTRQSGRKNLYFIATNATSTLSSIISSYPGPLVLVSIQCPNPDFNQPEHRWRMVKGSLVEAIADLLTPGGKVFLQSDVEAVAVRLREQFLNGSRGKLAVCEDEKTLNHGGWLKANPFEIQSDWEQHAVARGAPMYRLMLSKVVDC